MSTSARANSSESLMEDAAGALDNRNTSASTTDMVDNRPELHAKAKAELGDSHGVLAVQPSVQYDSKLDTARMSVQHQENSTDCSFEIGKGNGAAIAASVSSNKAEDVGRSLGLVSVGKERADDELADDHHASLRDSGGSEDLLGTERGSPGFCSKSADEQSKFKGTRPNPSVNVGDSNIVVSAGNSSLATSADVSATKSSPVNHMSINVQRQDMDRKQKETSDSNLMSNTFAEVTKDEGNHERPKKLVKELPKSSLSSVSKSSQSKKVFYASVSKRTLSDSKENMLHSTPKSPPLPNVSAAPHSEPSTTLHSEGASHAQKKASASENESGSNLPKKVAVLPQKGEKINQSVSQSVSKVNASITHAATPSSSPATATLSDEEVIASWISILASFPLPQSTSLLLLGS